MTEWWLSFCDADRPKGEQFLGVAIVGPAGNIAEAAMQAHAHGCNPGGQVMGIELPDGPGDGYGAIMERTPRNVLLSRADLDELGHNPKNLRELQEDTPNGHPASKDMHT